MRDLPVNKGTYKASVTIDGETIFVTYDITRTPVADDFTFTSPENTAYNGAGHEAVVVSKPECTGMGAITVLYYDENGEPLNGVPVDLGTYTVQINVAEGDAYNAAEP